MAFIKSWGGVVLASLGLACTVEPESGDTLELTTTGDGTTTSDVTATTIPLPIDDTTSGPGTTDGDSTTGLGGSGDSGSGGSSGGSSTGPGEDSGSTTDPGQSSSDGSETVYEVDWCRLQFPPMAEVAVGESFTVYVRLYVAGLTDQTTGNDPAPELVVEMGYGVDGSDPSLGMGAPWTYVPAVPNPGWDDAAEPNNDEYQGDLSIGMAGIYDYAARISGDGGTTWVYCDLDDLLTGGYTPDQAGHAEVGQ